MYGWKDIKCGGLVPHKLILGGAAAVIWVMQTNTKEKATLLAALSIAAVLIFIAVLVLGAPKPVEEITLTLAINPVPPSALVFIAEERGFFAEEGLSVEYANFQTGKLALDALLGGGAEIATTADVPIALAGLAGQEFNVVATIGWSKTDVQVVARKDSGIISAKDLRGKKIATTQGGGPLFFTHKFLEANNIALSEVNITYMLPSDMVIALANGELDAIVIFGPYNLNARELLGKNAVVFSPDDIYGETWNIVAGKEYAKKNPEGIRRFLRALLKAENFLKSNKQEAIEIIAKQSNLEKSIVESDLDLWNIELVLNKVLTDYLDLEAEWAIEKGISKSTILPDYGKLIDPSFLREFKPEAVST